MILLQSPALLASGGARRSGVSTPSAACNLPHPQKKSIDTRANTDILLSWMNLTTTQNYFFGNSKEQVFIDSGPPFLGMRATQTVKIQDY